MTKPTDESRQALLQCPSCRTHVKANEEQVCPFCEASLALVPRSGHAMQGARRSLTRRSSLLMASLFGLSTLGGVAIQACGTETPTEKSSTEKPGGDAGVTKDGSTTDRATTPDTAGPKDQGTVRDTPVLPPYGIPPDQ